ncbi:hypothetical protein J5X84_31495 [Streptosporangiaceae bacterium NEAU-GS5]|nr:hypothetical protein [Streptosporangiaceae bacterium NEAU-GS5]
MSAQESRLAAIAAASAAAFREGDYHQVRAEDVAAKVRLARGANSASGRSAVWLYNEVRSRRVLVALAVKQSFDAFVAGDPEPRQPADLTEGEALVHDALRQIGRFHRAERALLSQVRLGIGDVATSEKRGSAPQYPPQWPEGPFGHVAEAGWEGRITAYAEYLTPRLEAAASTVALPPDGWAKAGAERLSELAFRAFADDADGNIERQAAALTAFWATRDLTMLTGPWIDELHTAEAANRLMNERAVTPRAKAVGLELTMRVLLDNTPLLVRATRVSGRLMDLLGEASKDEQTPQDIRLLCDTASRHGLALLRIGHLADAMAAFERSREVAAQLPDHEEIKSYEARADHNIADTLIAMGRPGEAVDLARQVQAFRAVGVGGGAVSSAWRRYTLTQQVLAKAAARSGRVANAVGLAEEVLLDRAERLGQDDVNTAAALVTLAEVLLVAGYPAEARQRLPEAFTLHTDRLPTDSYWTQYDVVRLAEAELAAGSAPQAVRLLSHATVRTDWFAREVSPRLRAEAVVAYAVALAVCGEPDAALPFLESLPPDPYVIRARARVLLSAGRADAAAAELAGLVAAERDALDDYPGRAETLLWAARVANARGRRDEAELTAATLQQLVQGKVDVLHPVVLALRLELASWRLDDGRIDEANALLMPLLDRTPLAHGRPALGDGNPLLAEARALASQLGVGPVVTSQLWEDV